MNNKKIEFIGDYQTWDDALAKSDGYDSEVILNQTRKASLKVKQGEALYERDSYLFYDKIEYPHYLIAALYKNSIIHDSKLNVLDFGGSLGSSYNLIKKYINDSIPIKWNIVEQKKYVEVGKRDFQTNELFFFENIDECLERNEINFVLISSVLQYLPNPYLVIEELCNINAFHLLLDRTTFIKGKTERITIQNVPSFIYEASYPARFFVEKDIKEAFAKNSYISIDQFKSLDKNSPPCGKGYCIGILFEKNTAH